MMAGLLGRYRVQADPLRTERRIELVALLLAMVLLAVVLWHGVRLLTLQAPEMVPPAQDSLVISQARLPQAPDPEQRTEIRARPLFWAGRRPERAADPSEREALRRRAEAEAEKQRQGNSPEPIKNVTLVGVFGAGDSAGIIALIRGKERRLMVGEEVDGWSLQSVSLEGARFSSGDSEQQLELNRRAVRIPVVEVPDEGDPAKPAPQAQPPESLKGFGVPRPRSGGGSGGAN